MKYLFLFLLLTFFALTTLSCGDSENLESEVTEVPPEIVEMDSVFQSSSENIDIAVLPEEIHAVEYLELCYATSINIP